MTMAIIIVMIYFDDDNDYDKGDNYNDDIF